MGTASFTIPAGQSVDASFSLNQAGKTLLADHSRLPIQILVAGQAQGQPVITATKTTKLSGTNAHYRVWGVRVQGNGTITMKVRVTSPGLLSVLATAWNNNIASRKARAEVRHAPLDPAPHRFVFARASITVSKATTLNLTLRPTGRGHQLIAHPAYRPTLRLWVSYTPAYASTTETGFNNLHPTRQG